MIQEILPGVAHWTAPHPRIRQTVHSSFVLASGTIIDPMEPEDGFEALIELAEPRRVALSNRHHLRAGQALAERFSIPVLCHRAGLRDLPDGVEAFHFGQSVADDVLALEVGAICEEETAFHIAAAGGVLSFADGLIRTDDGELSFVPDVLMGEDPAAVKRDLRDALAGLLDQDFRHLLFAHGEPLLNEGRDALTSFLARAEA